MSNVARLSNDGVLSTSTFDDNTKSSFGISSNATAYSNEFKEPQVSVINTVSNSTKTDPLTLTGINPGNLVFYVASCDSAESHDFTLPTGFSEVSIVNNSQGPCHIIATKVSDGTSVTAQNMTFPSGATVQFMFAVSGIDTLQSSGSTSSDSNGMPGGSWTTDESKVGSYLFSFGFLDDDIVASSVGVENDLMNSSGTYSNQIFVGAADAGTSGAGSTLMVAFSDVKNDGGSSRSFSFTGDGDDLNALIRKYYIATTLRQKSNGFSEVGKLIDETEVFNSIRPNDLELHYNSGISTYISTGGGHYWNDISGNDRDLTLPFVAQSGDSSGFTASGSSFPAGISKYAGLKCQFSPKVLPGQTIKIKGLFTGGSNTNIINHVRGDIYYTLGNVSDGGTDNGYTTGVNSDTNFYSDFTMIPTSGNSVTNLYRKEVISSYQDFYKSGSTYDLVLRGHTKEVNALLYVQRGFANLSGSGYAFNSRNYMTAPFYGDGAGVVDGGSGNAYTGVTGTGARTIIFSVRPVLLATDSRPFSYGANSSGQRFTCRITSTNKFRVEIGSGYVETTNAVNLTYKNMFAVTCPDSGTVADIKIWINGREITSLTTSNPTLAINTSSANNVSIGGAEHESSKSYLTGVVDNVMIYSAALNDLEIKNIYNSVVKLLSPFTEDYVPVSP